MRKHLAVILTLILALSFVIPVSAAPENNQSQVLFQKQEIKDLNVLRDRAKKGISDIDKVPFKPDGVLKNEQTGEKNKVETYQTTQLLKQEKRANGEVVDTYATTLFGDVSIMSDASKYNSAWDSTGSCQAYATIYWNWVYDSSGIKHIDFLNASGGWNVYNVSLYSKQVTLGASGVTSWGGYVTQTATYYPSGMTWYYDVSSWVPVAANGQNPVGVSVYTTVMSRSGSKWSFWLYDNVY